MPRDQRVAAFRVFAGWAGSRLAGASPATGERVVRSRGLEPPRARPTAPSTLRVYQFRHDRIATAF